ncbi:MAG: hypothetical protein ACUVRV_08050 [Cyanobacteriota bacterium]
MAWQQVQLGVWYSPLGKLAPQWWLGWGSEGGFQSYRKEDQAPLTPAFRIHYQNQDQWLDVFLGASEEYPQRRHSLLDPTARVALHYLEEDLAQIQKLQRPHERIPPHLWQRLTAYRG